jgi:hypothetical protein
LARGETVEAIEFRSNDFWHDFADDFNAVRARIRDLTSQNDAKHDPDETIEAGV